MTSAEARFNKSLRPRKPEGSFGRTAQDGHLDSHTAPGLDLGDFVLSSAMDASTFFIHDLAVSIVLVPETHFR